ncbi:MAG TPA: alpha/beta fold hydrolase, partial [Thermoanaerobaculia bacterium]|nr:alpha/beta fold hydrolase [Thermoanaerobaculia bacterium]
MKKNSSMRSISGSALVVAFVFAASWAAAPVGGQSGGQSGSGPGKVYRYTSSLPDGSGAGDELLYVSGSRVEVFAKRKSDAVAQLTVFEMDGAGLAPRTVKLWDLLPAGRAFIGTLEALAGGPPGKPGNTARVEIFETGRPAETVAVPVFPWAPSGALSVLNLAFAGLKDPKGSFTVGLVGENEEPNEPPVRFSGPVQITYVGDEERGGVPTRKYRVEGEGVQNRGGFAWVHRDQKRLEALELKFDLGGGEEGDEGRNLQLVSAEPLSAAAWEEAKRAQLGPPPPKGPVEAVEVKPHPCRVPGVEKEALCATYPVWENRATKQGRKIGLNIVILPALGPDKQPDPVFHFGGGPGEGITEGAAFYPDIDRQKRDIVLIDQRGTGRSNPLDCTFFGEPVDFRRAAQDSFPLDETRKCRERLEKVADLTQYTTAAFADDLDEVRRWLGYGKINLSGGSYGTRMAQVYWRRHPDTVRSVVLVAVAPTDLFLPLRHAYSGQRALDLLLAECAAQAECRKAFPDTKADLKTIRERVEKGVTVTVTNTRTGEKQQVRPTWGLVAEGIRFLMYGQGGGSLPLQIQRAARGDLAPLVQMSIERRLGIDEILYMGLLFSVTCAEDLPYITEELTRKETAGTLLGDYRIRQQKA